MRRIAGRLLAAAGALFILGLLAGALLGMSVIRRGMSARMEPSKLEEFLALRMRSAATPARIRDLKNPLKLDADVLAGGRHHFADHCASCHANDGSGATEMGKNLYPKAPDLRAERSQGLSDGELYSIIQNGIRLSGMPAWGEAHENDDETWALVAFIRHLPQATAAELKEMEALNPKSPGEQGEQQDEDKFLADEAAGQADGGQAAAADAGASERGGMKGMKGMHHGGAP